MLCTSVKRDGLQRWGPRIEPGIKFFIPFLVCISICTGHISAYPVYLSLLLLHAYAQVVMRCSQILVLSADAILKRFAEFFSLWICWRSMCFPGLQFTWGNLLRTCWNSGTLLFPKQIHCSTTCSIWLIICILFIDCSQSKWRFPEIGVPPNHPLKWDFPWNKPSIFGVPHFRKISKSIHRFRDPLGPGWHGRDRPHAHGNADLCRGTYRYPVLQFVAIRFM